MATKKNYSTNCYPFLRTPSTSKMLSKGTQNRCGHFLKRRARFPRRCGCKDPLVFRMIIRWINYINKKHFIHKDITYFSQSEFCNNTVFRCFCNTRHIGLTWARDKDNFARKYSWVAGASVSATLRWSMRLNFETSKLLLFCTCSFINLSTIQKSQLLIVILW